MEKPRDMSGRERFWHQHLRQWQSSGLTQREYCRQHGLSSKSFGYWKRRKKAGSRPVCLVEVPLQRQPVVSVPARSTPVRLLVGSLHRIELERDFDTEALDQLIRFLEAR